MQQPVELLFPTAAIDHGGHAYPVCCMAKACNVQHYVPWSDDKCIVPHGVTLDVWSRVGNLFVMQENHAASVRAMIQYLTIGPENVRSTAEMLQQPPSR
jgi:hypothetical protein